MQNKTCGECKHYDMHGGCNKIPNTLWIHSTNIACIKFEAKNPTNGDVIRQGENRALRDVISGNSCDYCAFKTENGYCSKPNSKDCFDGIEEWLDAPADCVKQNGNHDTQADLCKADNTESEVKDEQ